ncbi:phytanoyl-CoA dioxygenase [Naematelia encephala]|uniref:Phytanoyl-CoA dioxygenase n=1 Tax=Naematelia encephala TaxID=71784 RepID=A0A1Y2B4Y3_9TREE|nr:phytanoyl-CoA dioxygenase [Naematelia encephala]
MPIKVDEAPNGHAPSKLPTVQRLPSTATVDEVCEELKLAGGVIIERFLENEVLDQMEAELRPYLEADWTKNKEIVSEDSFLVSRTQRCAGFFGKSKTSALAFLTNKLWRGVSDKFMTDRYSYWEGPVRKTATCAPAVNNSIVFSVRPGAPNQPLHRDDIVQHYINEAIDVYPDLDSEHHREGCIGLFIAGRPSTKANGATRFIPGSHLWAEDVPPLESQAFYAEMARGDACIILGSAYHGGSANTTEDEERLLFSSFMVRGYFRQEENVYLSTPISTVSKFPKDVQKVFGYQRYFPHGNYGPDGRDPIESVEKWEEYWSCGKPADATVQFKP